MKAGEMRESTSRLHPHSKVRGLLPNVLVGKGNLSRDTCNGFYDHSGPRIITTPTAGFN